MLFLSLRCSPLCILQDLVSCGIQSLCSQNPLRSCFVLCCCCLLTGVSPVLDEKSLLPEGRDRAFDSILDPCTVPASAQGMAVGQRSTITLYTLSRKVLVGPHSSVLCCSLSHGTGTSCVLAKSLGLSQHPACISLCQQDSLPSFFPSKAHILGSKVSEP